MINRKRASDIDEEFRYELGQSSFGTFLVASSDIGVVSILIGDDPITLVDDLQRRFPKARLTVASGRVKKSISAVIKFLERPTAGLAFRLDMRGSPFQLKVWKALRKIPAGRTTTYAEIARKIGAPRAMRAIGNACKANNLAIAVPCHRVVHGSGTVLRGNYHWGIERQRTMLLREGVSLHESING